MGVLSARLAAAAAEALAALAAVRRLGRHLPHPHPPIPVAVSYPSSPSSPRPVHCDPIKFSRGPAKRDPPPWDDPGLGYTFDARSGFRSPTHADEHFAGYAVGPARGDNGTRSTG